MLNFVDIFLNSITMYRLMLYYLILLLIVAFIYSIFGILSFAPFTLLFSSALSVVICYVANKILAKLFNIQTNVESMYITALILALIIDPGSYVFIAIAGIIAMASKYILAINHKHLFNPAAVSVVTTGILLHSYASWWVGTMAMFPFLLLGVFIAHKLRKFEQVFWFLFISLILFVILAYLRGSRDLFVVINGAFIASPILFFTFVMLTEPLTSPPTKFLQSIYGAFIGVIFGFHLASLELALCVGNIFSYLVSPKYRLMLKLKKRNKLANNIYEFVFATSQKVKFKAGQYLEWTMAPTKADDRGNRRYFTVSSSPTEKDVKIGMKFPEAQASTFKKAMLNMKIGDKIVAGQLAGEFTLPKDTKEKLVFIAGGIGVTPYRSIIKYLIDMNEKRDIVFMYSEKTKDSFVYKDIFDEAVKKLGVKVIYFESDVKGHMTSDIIKSEIPDYKKRLFYLSGPHRMVTGFEEILKHLNLPQARIKVDYFPGF